MKKSSTETGTIQSHLYSLIISEDILKDFNIEKIEEKETILLIELIEKRENVLRLNQGNDLVLNGYMNPIELVNFPVMGKQCLLKLIRRRWKERVSGEGSYHNEYAYAIEGTKITPKFGAFLKEIGR